MLPWEKWGTWGAKKVTFTVCHSGKLKLTFTSPNIISTSPKSVLMSRLISQFFCNLNSSKNFTCPSGKLTTEFTSPIAKSTSYGLLDTTFFAHWYPLGIFCLLWTLSKPKISHLTSVLPSYKADTTVAIFALFLKCWKNLSDIYKITEYQLILKQHGAFCLVVTDIPRADISNYSKISVVFQQIDSIAKTVIKSHKNQNSERDVRWSLPFFILIPED